MARVTPEHIDARKAAILEAAARVFGRKGPATATMQEIADEADLSAGAIYRYYPGKDELMQEFFKICCEDGPVSLLNDEIPEGLDSVERLQLGAQRIRQLWNEQPCEMSMGQWEAHFAGIRDPDAIGCYVKGGHEAVRDVIEEMIVAGQEAGEIAPEFDSRALAMVLHATAMGINVMSLDSSENRNLMMNTFVDMLDRLRPCPE